MNTLIKHTIKNVFYNPVVTILTGLEIIVLISCALFLSFVHDVSGQITTLKVFGISVLSNIFFNDILPTLSHILLFAVLLVVIISFGSLYTRIYINPINKLVLISDISRVKLILSSFAGINFYFLINFTFFTAVFASIIYLKTNVFIIEPFILFTNLFLFLMSLSVIVNLFSFLLKNESISVLIGLLFPFLISPYLSKVVNNADTFLEKILLGLYYLLPPLTMELSSYLRIYNAHIYNFEKILLTVPYILFYLFIVLYLFKNVDIND